MPTDLDALARRFREAGRAHHQAYLATDGDDPEWPLWYAEHLHAALQQDLGVRFTRSELVYLLVLADKTHREEAPETDWPAFYARLLASHFSPA